MKLPRKKKSDIPIGSYEFSVCQLDIFFLLLSYLDEDNKSDYTYTLSTDVIEKITGRRWEMKEIQIATQGIGSRVFTIDTEKSHKQIWFFQSFQYKENSNEFKATISDISRPYLLMIKKKIAGLEFKNLVMEGPERFRLF
ncbi:MAG: RepB family plasmid replication initiator protein [Thiothrix sp.]|nr:MAG: RepB family plasmid replication initiator protein [Thiothrix sp.]